MDGFVINTLVIIYLFFNSLVFNCVGFSKIGLSKIGFSKIGFLNLGFYDIGTDHYKDLSIDCRCSIIKLVRMLVRSCRKRFLR